MRKISLVAALLLIAIRPLYSSENTTVHSSEPPTSSADVDTQLGMAALKSLQDGNVRFSDGKAKHPHQETQTREELTKGQSPQTIVLSCSDSRVPPEMVFDQGLGDVFTIRLAGHVPNSEAIASIEYAIEHLGSKLLIVMGHESCGAVKAAITTPANKSVGSSHLDRLLSEVRPNIAEAHANTEDPTLRLAVKDHVSVVMRDLIKRSRIIRDHVHAGHLVVAEGIYSLKSGKVEFWDVGEKFVSIKRSY